MQTGFWFSKTETSLSRAGMKNSLQKVDFTLISTIHSLKTEAVRQLPDTDTKKQIEKRDTENRYKAKPRACVGSGLCRLYYL